MAADQPYGYVVIHEPMANEGLHLGRGIHGTVLGSPIPTEAQARERAAMFAERSPESRWVVCALLPLDDGMQLTLDAEAL